MDYFNACQHIHVYYQLYNRGNSRYFAEYEDYVNSDNVSMYIIVNKSYRKVGKFGVIGGITNNNIQNRLILYKRAYNVQEGYEIKLILKSI